MVALFRYTLAILLHSQRYLPPVLLYFVVAAAFVHGDPNQPALPIFGVLAAATVVLAAWLTVVLIAAEDPVQRAITVVNAGRSWRVLVAAVSVVLAWCAVLSAVVLAVPVVFGFRGITGLDVLAGAEGLLTGACAGTAIGLVTSRLVIRRPGYGLLATLLLLPLFVLVHGIPPVNPVVTLLIHTTSATAGVIGRTTGYAAVGAVLLVAGGAVAHVVAGRRD